MKIAHIIAVILLASIPAASSEQSAPAPKKFDELSTTELLTLATEVREWRSTRAGQSAMQHEFMSASAAQALASFPSTPPSIAARQLFMKSQVGGNKGVKRNSASTFVGTNASAFTDPNMRELLKRYHDGKLRIAELAKTQPNATFSMQTPFALMTPEEFQEFFSPGGSSLIPDILIKSTVTTGNRTRSLRQLANPASVDWVANGVVTTPQDQGSCNACTVFATVAAVESGYAIATGNAVPSLSEQDIINCGPLQGSCSTGGKTHHSLNWIVNYNGGSLCSRDSFPFGGWNGATVTCSRYDDPTKTCYKPDLGVIGYIQTFRCDHSCQICDVEVA